ncbi:MAG: protein-methionine-sulfoxide reductase catalytic subunit MsrP [Burkholderiaceae bacterium]|nr:protein-methionine-sulfoxide reductase catalytic subunit MsrP [Burkholderiaceae bacterium]
MPLIRRSPQDSGFEHPRPSEITPHAVYAARREWLRRQGLAALAAPWLLGAATGSAQTSPAAATPRPGRLPALPAQRSSLPGATTLERPTDYADVTGYNNFYEFGTDKGDPARRAGTLKTRPWTVVVEGEVHRPVRFGLEELLRLAPMEERIYRLRCVEGWSMVVPWVGWPLAQLIRRVEPTGNAKFVEFETLADPAQMPGLASRVLQWPYTEGLRLDEAQHPLTLLAFGLYGELLPNQNGAPLRLVLPWKYGFKSAKSIVRIRFTERQPISSWTRAAPQEYGFYSNVNPEVAHPRWSQASERRIGEDGLLARKRPTLKFNGYEAQVGSLYAGMDLRRHF